jgi:UDP-N-acetylglucosamine 2-epimerase (non-hydrolysing)
VLFVAHPRTLKNLDSFELKNQLTSTGRIQLLEPLPYVNFMNIVIGAKLVISDSGGLQEETTYLNIPCLTLRENTERPITISQGTNRLVGAGNLAESVDQVLDGQWQAGICPPLWDGRTAERAVECLERRDKTNN